MTPDDSGILRFGGFELDPATGELWQAGEPVDLPPQPQPTRLLALLTRSPGGIVSWERIQDEVWSDTVVEFDQAINNAVRQVRDALGDDASAPRSSRLSRGAGTGSSLPPGRWGPTRAPQSDTTKKWRPFMPFREGRRHRTAGQVAGPRLDSGR